MDPTPTPTDWRVLVAHVVLDAVIVLALAWLVHAHAVDPSVMIAPLGMIVGARAARATGIGPKGGGGGVGGVATIALAIGGLFSRAYLSARLAVVALAMLVGLVACSSSTMRTIESGAVHLGEDACVWIHPSDAKVAAIEAALCVLESEIAPHLSAIRERRGAAAGSSSVIVKVSASSAR